MKTGALIIVALLVALCPAAKAADVGIIPSLGFGLSSLDFTRSTGEQDNSQFNIVDIGITATYQRFYASTNAQLPFSDEYTYGPALIRQFKRQDFGISLGYYVLDSLSVFGGYSYGKTAIISFDGGSGLPPYPVYTQHLDSGPFIGANYSMNVGKSGSLGLNVAYADMDGLYVVQDSDPGGVSTHEEGKTSGFSIGVSWSGTIDNKFNYYVTYKQKSYRTDLVTISIDKNFNIVTAGISLPL